MVFPNLPHPHPWSYQNNYQTSRTGQHSNLLLWLRFLKALTISRTYRFVCTLYLVEGIWYFDSKAKRSAFLDLNWFAFWSNKPLKWFDWCHGFAIRDAEMANMRWKTGRKGGLTHLTKLPPVPCAFGLLGHRPQCLVVLQNLKRKGGGKICPLLRF